MCGSWQVIALESPENICLNCLPDNSPVLSDSIHESNVMIDDGRVGKVYTRQPPFLKEYIVIYCTNCGF